MLSLLALLILNIAQTIETPYVRVDGDPVSNDNKNISNTHAFSKNINILNINNSFSLNASDVLKQSPGVYVRSLGGSADFTELSIRGSHSTQLGIYLDGVPITPSSLSSIDLSTLNLNGLDSIDIYRGVTPLEWGYEGMAGAIYLRSLKGSIQAPQFKIVIGAGSFGERSLNLSYQLPLNSYKTGHTYQKNRSQWQLAFNAQYYGKQGDFPFYDDNGTPLNASDDQLTYRINNDVNSGHFQIKLTGYLNQKLGNLVLYSQVYAKEQGVVAPNSQTQNQARYLLVKPTHYLAWNNIKPTNHLKIDVLVSNSGQWSEFVNPLVLLSTFSLQQNTSEFNNRISSVFKYSSHSWYLLTLSINQSVNLFKLKSIQSKISTQSLTRVNLGGSLGSQFFLLNHYLNLEGGVRFDAFWDQGQISQNAFIENQLRNVNNVQLLIQSQLGIKVKLYSDVHALAHVALRQRVPGMYDLFGLPGALRGDADLKSEKEWLFDLGVTAKIKDFLQLEATYSETRYSQLISYIQVGQGLPAAVNLGESLSRVIELSGSLINNQWLNFDLNYTYQNTKNLNQNSYYGKPIPGKPQHIAWARTIFKLPANIGLSLGYELEYSSHSALNPSADFWAPQRYQSHLSLNWQSNKLPFIFHFQVNNLFNQQIGTLDATILGKNRTINVPVIDYVGYPLPGRNIHFSISYTGFKKQI